MDNTARDIQISQAQSNPNILSPLVGAPPQSNLAQRAEAQPNPQAAYAEAGKVGQELAGRLYGSGNLQGMAKNWDDMIGELATYDKEMETQYFPSQQGYVPNPVDRAGYVGNLGGMLGSNIRATGSAVQSVEAGYSNAISGVVQQFVQFYQMAEDRREREAERKRLEEGDKINNLISILGKTGGKLDYGGQSYEFAGPESRLKDTSIIEVGGRKKLIDNQTGQVIQDLGEANVTSNIFGTLGAATTTPQGKQYFPPPMSAPAGTTQFYGGATWRSLGSSRWEMTGTGTQTSPTPNLRPSSTSGTSATLNKPPLSSFWSQ